ncbi:hypothetical protein NDN08_000799 [Rhodosorus marinus]|uniref:RING-type domain-containing protein n=1 Tax=Rhodosorus marinus TaxID=101924 RepID=A0AAV8US22_9RHOD|nr:hypothetical protein NDN08_000799 [Rhodosorus marinus]
MTDTSRCTACTSPRKLVLSVPQTTSENLTTPSKSTSPPAQNGTGSSKTPPSRYSQSSRTISNTLVEDRQERYQRLKQLKTEKEVEKQRILAQIREDAEGRVQKFHPAVPGVESDKIPGAVPERENPQKTDITCFELAIRCDNCFIVKGEFHRSTKLREIREHALLASQSTSPQAGEDSQSSGQPFAGGGTYVLKGCEEAKQYRENYEEQKQRIFEEARRVREKEWVSDEPPSSSTPRKVPTDYELVDPLSRKHFGEDLMDLSLSEAGLSPKSMLVLQKTRRRVDSVPQAESHRAGTQEPNNHTSPSMDLDPAAKQAREDMRKAIASAAARRESEELVVADEAIVAPVVAERSKDNEADLTPEPELRLLRSDEMDARAEAAALAAEKRLEAAKLEVPAPGSSSRSPQKVKPLVEELSPVQKSQQMYKTELRRKQEERETILRQIAAERKESVIKREQEKRRREAELQKLNCDAGEQVADPELRRSNDDVELRIRKINGDVVMRKFPCHDTLRHVLVSVLAEDEEPDMSGYSILIPFPAQQFMESDMDVSIGSAGLGPRGTVCLQNETTRGTLTIAPPRGLPRHNPFLDGRPEGFPEGLTAYDDGPEDLTYETLLEWEERRAAMGRITGAGEAIITKLPVEQITEEGLERCPMCAICRCDFEEEASVAHLPCTHFYHDDCIHRWLSTWKVCPMCRAEVAVD